MILFAQFFVNFRLFLSSIGPRELHLPLAIDKLCKSGWSVVQTTLRERSSDAGPAETGVLRPCVLGLGLSPVGDRGVGNAPTKSAHRGRRRGQGDTLGHPLAPAYRVTRMNRDFSNDHLVTCRGSRRIDREAIESDFIVPDYYVIAVPRCNLVFRLFVSTRTRRRPSSSLGVARVSYLSLFVSFFPSRYRARASPCFSLLYV